MSKLSPARKVAHDVLCECERRGAYARDLLAHRSAVKALDSRDSAFAARLALGVTATEGILDDLLNRFLSKPNKVAPRVRMALRISAFEMLYLDTPGHVAVSQGVELVRANAKSAAGLANAVLRKVDGAIDGFRAADDLDGAGEDAKRVTRLCRALGMPEWLCRRLMDRFDDSQLGIFEFAGNLTPAPMAIYVNPRSYGKDNRPEGSIDPIFPGCIAPVNAAKAVASGALERASIVASDVNAQLIATAATRPGTCLEIGAGRGTKTYVMMCQGKRAGMERTHYALDLHERKCDQNLQRLRLAGIHGVRTIAGDACNLDQTLTSFDAREGERMLFDTVFVDAPCSGTGTMRRHPEIPWRLTQKDVDETLPKLQLTMLNEAARRVAPGGELFYATCSVLCSENDDVVNAFLQGSEGRRFKIAPVSEADICSCEGFGPVAGFLKSRENCQGLFQSVPRDADSFDGHFCARFVRV